MPDDLSPKEGLYPFRDWSMEMKRSVSPSISVLSGASYGRTWLPSAVLTMRSMGHQLYQNCQSHLDMPETLPPRCDLLIFRWRPCPPNATRFVSAIRSCLHLSDSTNFSIDLAGRNTSRAIFGPSTLPKRQIARTHSASYLLTPFRISNTTCRIFTASLWPKI